MLVDLSGVSLANEDCVNEDDEGELGLNYFWPVRSWSEGDYHRLDLDADHDELELAQALEAGANKVTVTADYDVGRPNPCRSENQPEEAELQLTSKK